MALALAAFALQGCLARAAVDVVTLPVKAVYLYPLCRDFRQVLGA